MKSDEYMANVDTTLNIEGMDYDKVLELKNAVSNAEIDYFMMDILRAAHRAIINNDITSLEDYQSDKAVLPANAAKKRILNLIKIYPERFNIHDRTGFDGLVIDVLALSGGPEGLYLIADIKTSESLYRWMYPPKLPDNPKPDEPDGKVKVTVTCNGATSTSAESVTISEGSDFTSLFVPNADFVFSKITINDQAYTSLKDITSNDGMSLAETNNGYKLILQKVAQDTDIVFTCKYDSTIKTFRVDGDLVGCKPNCELPIVVNEGNDVMLAITGDSGYTLSLLMIDNVDYTSLWEQGITEFAHGKLTDIPDDDYSVTISGNTINMRFSTLSCDHKIKCSYQIPTCTVTGSGDHVTLSPRTADVLISQNQVVTITPDEDYDINSIECEVPYVTNLETDNSMVITFENITQDIVYTVITKERSSDDPSPVDKTFTIKGTGSNVTMSPNPVTVKENSTVTISITADEGYKITNISTDCEDSTQEINEATATFTVNNIKSDVMYVVTTEMITIDPKPEKTYTITTNIGAAASDDHNIVVTSPELTSADKLYTFKVENEASATMTLTSGYMTGNKYLTKMSQVTIKDTDTAETILTSSVNVSDTGTVKTNLENTSGDIIGTIESSVSENTYTYIVVINRVTQNLTIAFGTTNVDIGQGNKT